MTKFYLILLCFWLTSCAGYRFSQQDNPLSQYGIQSISMPTFYNYSTLPHVGAEFSREVYEMMMGFPSLKVKSGFNNSTDAVLIGIVKSPEKLRDTTKVQNLRVAQGSPPMQLERGERNFIFQEQQVFSFIFKLSLLKVPSEAELEVLRSSLGELAQTNDRVIFNEMIPITASYNREVFDDEAVSVVGTQNKGALQKSVKNMAEQAAQSVKEMIMYAF